MVTGQAAPTEHVRTRRRFERAATGVRPVPEHDVPALLETLLRHAVVMFEAPAAAVFLAEAAGEPPRVVAAQVMGFVDPMASADFAEQVMACGGAWQRDETGVAAAAPVPGGEGAIGALWIAAPDGRAPLRDDELRLLPAFAEIAAAALQSPVASPFAAMAAGGGIEAMSALLNLRDGYAAADAEEMVRLAGGIGRRLGMSAEHLAELSIAARLHDIGKIAVPDRILHKPGPLDETERLVMQRHPVWGAETLARTPGLRHVAEIVRSHHERWDGAGYPAGIAGEDIPLVSRIIGACEAFRAMTSERPYRRSLERGQALAVVARGAGANFDPAVAHAMVSVLAQQGVTPTTVARRGQQAVQGSGQRAPTGYGGKMTAALERLDVLPALTESRDRLLALVADARPSVAAIVSTIESDLALVIAVLRLANQNCGPREGITTIPDAVAALTPEGVEMLALRIAVVDFFEQAPGWGAPPEQVRLHAVAVGRAADAIARLAGWRERDELLVAALLHDVGKLVLGHAAPGYPEQVHGQACTPDGRVRAERHALGLDHATIGGVLLRRWRLPQSIAEAVEHHHDEHPAHPGAAVIRLADLLVHHLHGNRIDHERLLPAAEAVGLSAQELRSLIYELPSASSGVRRMTEPCPLTPKQLEVIRLLAGGMVYKEIGEAVFLSPSTVRTHLHNAYQRLGVANRAQAVIKCTECGWL